MKKIFLTITGVIVLGGLIWGGSFYWQNLRGIGPAINPPATPIADILKPGVNSTGLPLKLPLGFSVSIFAKDLGNPRVLISGLGGFIVSVPAQGKVFSLQDTDNDGVSDKTTILAEGLNQPHGLAEHCRGDQCVLYIAETNGVVRYEYDYVNHKLMNKKQILDLPTGGIHFTRTLKIIETEPGLQKLLVSVGSTCNACIEDDGRRAKVLIANLDGSDVQTYASGLRNAVFLATNPLTKQVWVTEMGRDLLGDDIPPDEINILQAGKDYGWPYCFGKKIQDKSFSNSDSAAQRCKNSEASHIDLQAHSAPLGLAFVPPNWGWPKDYENSLFVSYHGSWNRSVPTGYKVIRFKLDEQGKVLSQDDFITGWLTSSENALGRPVDILIAPDGNMFVTDDKAGVIYRVKYDS